MWLRTCRTEIPRIVTRLINACWKLFIWSLGLGFVAAVGVFGYFYLQLDEQVRRQAELLLARHYDGLRVEVGGARVVKGRGVRLYDLAISRPLPTGERQPLLTVEEAMLDCSTDWNEMLTGDLGIQRVLAKRPVLHVTRQVDGAWSIASLWPPPDFGDNPPVVDVEDGTLLVSGATDAYAQAFTIAGINATLTPELVGAGATLTSTATVGKTRVYRITATSVDRLAKHVRVEGRASPDDGRIDLSAEVQALEISPEIAAGLSAAGIGVGQQLQLDGVASGRFHVSRPAGSTEVPEVNCEFSLTDGRCAHPSLPRPITELAVRGKCDRSRCVIEQLTGKCGSADVALACERAGWGPRAPLGLRARVVGLPLDQQLRSVLPEVLRDRWDRYDPAGGVDADLQLTYDGQNWRPVLTVKCRQVAFTETKHFPYRLEQGVGTLVYRQSVEQPGGQLSVDLVGLGQGRPIRVGVEVADLAIGIANQAPGDGPPPPRPESHGWAEVSGTDVPIHDQLIAAIPPQAQQVVNSLHPEGRFHFRWRGERAAIDGAELESMLEIELDGCAIQYDHFPYQVRDVRGKVTCRNNRFWRFEGLESRSPSRDTVVTGSGGLEPSGEGNRLQLTITADDVALDGELRRALDPEIQNVWNQLQPQGRIDFVALVDHQSLPGQPTKPNVRVGLRPHNRSVSIEPAFLPYPYRLDHLGGQFNYADGQLSMSDVSARHGRVEVFTHGGWRKSDDGGWQLMFRGLRADHLTASRDLLLALPPRLQKVIDGLQPNGTFALYNTALAFRKPAGAASRLESSWNLNLECQQSDLHCGTLLEDVSGSVRLVGRSDGNEGYTSGELALDSLIWRNIQLTKIRGPLSIDQTPTGSIVMLGRSASERQQRQRQQPEQQNPRRQPTARDVLANVYGGTIIGNVVVRNEGIPRFNLSAALAGADLRQYALERLGGRNDVTGTINGRLQLENTGTSTDAMTGRGELHLVDANIYRLPQMVALLKVLQNRSPDTTAFNQCDSEFTISGKHLNFQKLNLLGDAVSLYGAGSSTLAGDELNLMFRTEMGRRQIPILSSLVGQAQAQILQLRVDGTAKSPVFHPETLPTVKKTLESIPAALQPLVDPEPRSAKSRFPLWPFRQ